LIEPDAVDSSKPILEIYDLTRNEVRILSYIGQA